MNSINKLLTICLLFIFLMDAIVSYLWSKRNYVSYREPYSSRAQPQTTYEYLLTNPTKFKKATNFNVEIWLNKFWPRLKKYVELPRSEIILNKYNLKTFENNDKKLPKKHKRGCAISPEKLILIDFVFLFLLFFFLLCFVFSIFVSLVLLFFFFSNLFITCVVFCFSAYVLVFLVFFFFQKVFVNFFITN